MRSSPSESTIFLGNVASNYYSLNTGSWGQLPPQSDPVAILGKVPFGNFDTVSNVQLAASTDGDFLLAWESPAASEAAQIFIAHFSSRTRTWNRGAAPGAGRAADAPTASLQRLAAHRQRCRVATRWCCGPRRENGDRATALKAIRVDHAGAACSGVQVIDGAVGGVAVRADLAVDPQGNAIAIWQQFEKDVSTIARAATSRSTASTPPPAPGQARCSPRLNPATRSVRAQARQWAAKRCSGGSRKRAVSTASRRCCNH